MLPDNVEEILSPQQRAAVTKAEKYGKDAHAKWGAKGGQAKVPKGYSMNPDKTGGRMRQKELRDLKNSVE